MKRVLVVAGASGDLFAQKVAPALAWLHSQKRLEEVAIVGVSRKSWSADDFRSHVSAALESRSAAFDPSFLQLLDFRSSDFEKTESVVDLIGWMSDIHKKDGTHFSLYLSVSPKLYELVFTALAHAEQKHSHNAKGWLSLIVEKPYGDSEASAQKLDEIIVPVLGADAIYRIDHYLTKETIQDILAFRFANRIFEAAWDNRSIAKIRIHAYETATVAKRAAFYDVTGALRDMGQNHLLQMLAAVTMDEPMSADADGLRSARAAIFKHLSVANGGVTVGQYEGYASSEGVVAGSKTDTFFRIDATIDTPRWKGVEIELSSGKALDRKETYIEVEFKVATVDFSRFKGQIKANIIRFSLFPKEEVWISIFGKEPGLDAGLKRRAFGYSMHEDGVQGKDLAYAAVLDAALDGDKDQFAGKDEVHAAWRFIDGIRATLADRNLVAYAPGTDPDMIQTKENMLK
jgi:glucose-6-phosphate 1-dehydrogenase